VGTRAPQKLKNDGFEQFARNCSLGNMRIRKYKQKSGGTIRPDEKCNDGRRDCIFLAKHGKPSVKELEV